MGAEEEAAAADRTAGLGSLGTAEEEEEEEVAGILVLTEEEEEEGL